MTDKLDLTLFGGTGFTGRLTAEYLARTRGSGLVWALAGRNMAKLEDVRRSLAGIDPALADLPLVQADASDPASLEAVARRSRVICTTVGPYARYGRALVQAAAAAGADYCDLTGEVAFIRDSIDAAHERATQTGARIVHCCGFDSIPSDLGVLMLHDHLTKAGKTLGRAKLFLTRMRGGVSGGTIQSAIDIVEEAVTNPAMRRIFGDPYALMPDRRADRGPDKGDQKGVAWDADARTWTAPFAMAGVNTRVVRRSNAVLGFPYGRDFRYEEVLGMRAGPTGFGRAVALTAGLGAFVTLASFGPTRSLLRRLVPQPGEGPSKEARERGSFEIEILGWARGEERPSVVGRVEGFADPGYGETAKMLAETAVLLADTAGKTEKISGGVLTPASALGMPLVERLRVAGMRFEVEDLGAPDARSRARHEGPSFKASATRP